MPLARLTNEGELLVLFGIGFGGLIAIVLGAVVVRAACAINNKLVEGRDPKWTVAEPSFVVAMFIVFAVMASSATAIGLAHWIAPMFSGRAEAALMATVYSTIAAALISWIVFTLLVGSSPVRGILAMSIFLGLATVTASVVFGLILIAVLVYSALARLL